MSRHVVALEPEGTESRRTGVLKRTIVILVRMSIAFVTFARLVIDALDILESDLLEVI